MAMSPLFRLQYTQLLTAHVEAATEHEAREMWLEGLDDYDLDGEELNDIREVGESHD